jgi:large subunit ribosomal protein L29
MKLEEIRALSIDEVKVKLADAREELMKLRFQQVSGQLTDTSRLRIMRREIARLMTVQNQLEKTSEQEGVA